MAAASKTDLASEIASEIGGHAGLDERLSLLLELAPGPAVFTTSFGLEDQVLTHVIATSGLPIRLVTLDTGRLFPETISVWAETEQRYGVKVAAFAPDAAETQALVARFGVQGFRASVEARLACCHIRKVVPLARALEGAGIWVTGLRASQSRARGEVSFAEWDETHSLIKANPLADWSREAALDFATRNDVPLNELHAKGFASIGCAPCTRAIAPGEPERAGRWWWENAEEEEWQGKKECGLHSRPRAGVLEPA
jgi:phosphoadenosine phosphosulfate reductase